MEILNRRHGEIISNSRQLAAIKDAFGEKHTKGNGFQAMIIIIVFLLVGDRYVRDYLGDCALPNRVSEFQMEKKAFTGPRGTFIKRLCDAEKLASFGSN